MSVPPHSKGKTANIAKNRKNHCKVREVIFRVLNDALSIFVLWLP